MKRSPLARKARLLPGKKRLARKSILDRGKQMERGKRLRMIGRGKRRELPLLVLFRGDVLAAANGRCSRCRHRKTAGELEAHHLVQRTRAKGWEHIHNAAVNGVALCSGAGRCHALVTDHACHDWRDWVLTLVEGRERARLVLSGKGARHAV